MGFVHEDFGPGELASTRIVRGQREFLVEGSGFSIWLTEREFKRHGGSELVNDENSTTLPYNPEPQFNALLPETETTMQPNDHIDPEERLHPADSISFADESEEEPGPNPDLFAKGASADPYDMIRVKESSLEYDYLDPRVGQYMDLIEADKQMRTAAWKDVRSKALRLRREGKVHVKTANPEAIYASVEGDTGTYDTIIIRGNVFDLGGQSVTQWSCDCGWGKWAFKRKISYVGRFCSHAYATYLEMQSQVNKGKKQWKRKKSDFGGVEELGSPDHFQNWLANTGQEFSKQSLDDYGYENALAPWELDGLRDHIRNRVFSQKVANPAALAPMLLRALPAAGAMMGGGGGGEEQQAPAEPEGPSVDEAYNGLYAARDRNYRTEGPGDPNDHNWSYDEEGGPEDDGWEEGKVWDDNSGSYIWGSRRESDALRTKPNRLVPDFVFNDTEDEHYFTDVTEDDRVTTGPDQIVHLSSYNDAFGYYQHWADQNGHDWGEPTTLDAFLGAHPDYPGYAAAGIHDKLWEGADQPGDPGQFDEPGGSYLRGGSRTADFLNINLDDLGTADNEMSGKSDEALLESLRDHARNDDIEDDFGNMSDRNEEISDTVEELRARGYDADNLVAMVKSGNFPFPQNHDEPFQGSGGYQREWISSSEDYVKMHEQKYRQDVTDGDGITKYTDEESQQKQGMRRVAGRQYSLAQQAELINERHPLGARNLDELDLEGTHYLD